MSEEQEEKEKVKMEGYSVPQLKPLCLKCEKELDEREILEMLLRRLYEVKKVKILQHGYLTKLNAEMWNLSNKLDKAYEEVLEELEGEVTNTDIKQCEAKTRAINGRKKLLADKKNAIIQSRLLLKNLHAMEASIKADIFKLEQGVEE